MKSRLGVLIKGELSRLNKYGVTSVSILVAFIWGVVLFLINEDSLNSILPFILLIDATLMCVMYIGAEMYFEKSESTISTMLVTPVSNNEMVLSKVIANTIHNLLSSLLIIGVFYFIRNIDINIFLLLLAIVISTVAFTIGGLVLSYYQKDFTTLLVNMFVLGFVLFIPSILVLFEVLKGEIWEKIMLINPVHASQIIIKGGFNGYEYGFDYYMALGYLFFGGILLYFLVAIPKFQNYAVRQSGV